MLAICFVNVGIGCVFGLVFSLLFVNFDSGWKRVISILIPSSASCGGFWFLYDKYNISDYRIVFFGIGCLLSSFLICFIAFMFIMCKIIKDKQDAGIIRIRDIILGQKNYIQHYYKKRAQEINDRLNITELEKREEELKHKENILNTEKEMLEQEKEELKKATQGKLRIRLPENKNLAVTKEFLELFPAYIADLSNFIESINLETEIFCEDHNDINLSDFKVFLILLSIRILEHLFGKSGKDVRVHFRYYDENRHGYEKLVSIIGEKESKRNMTFIPYDKANMIIKSFECKRALIKSYNIEYDFIGNNSTTWTEYMTGTFYNITRNGIPCLSFGISVKNSTKYKNLFNFLNYCKFESYLQEVIERFDEKYNIEAILYG